MKILKKITSSAVHRIVPSISGEYLLCRRNRFDVLRFDDGAAKIVFSSDTISNAADVFYNKFNHQALLVNTEGKSLLYDLNSYEKLAQFSMGHEMFGRGITSDESGFYYIDKSGNVIFLDSNGKARASSFEKDGLVDDVVCLKEEVFKFVRMENGQYEISCYKNQKLDKKNIVRGVEFINKRRMDFNHEVMFLLVDEPSKQVGNMIQESVYSFDENKMSFNHKFTIPNDEKWCVVYDFAVCLQRNLLVCACGDSVYVVDLKSGEIIDSMKGEYLCSVVFHTTHELLIGTWKGMYRVEIE